MCKFAINIPIFITVRGDSKENIDKNKLALKFSYIFIKENNLFKQTFIISDNEELIDYSKELGFENQILHICGQDKDIKYLEYSAIYRYSIENKYLPDWFIILNVDQIFKTNNLLCNCINNIEDKYDIITSYTYISDRSKFFIDENNKLNNSYHLLSSEKNRVKMLDSSIYAIKSSFAFECMSYNDPSEKFWQGNFKFFENKDLYTDIYTIDDIYKFNNIISYIQEVKK